MSLISSIYMASNALQADQIGLQVVGQNVANASTPGYIRETVDYVPAGTQRDGNLLLGSGVLVAGIKQQIDNFLQEQVRGANSSVANSQLQQQTYQQLEGLLNALGNTNGGTNLGSNLTSFFNSISQV